MTRDDVVDLLKVMTAYDRRTVGEADVLVWSEQAGRGQWTRDEAVEAVHEHHRRSGEFLKPVHVHELLRAQRRARLERAPASKAPDDRALMARFEAIADAKAADDEPTRALSPASADRVERMRSFVVRNLDEAARRGARARAAHEAAVAAGSPSPAESEPA